MRDTERGDESVLTEPRSDHIEILRSNTRTAIGILLGAATLLSVVPIMVQWLRLFQLTTLEQVLASVALLLLFVTGLVTKSSIDLYRRIQRIRTEHQQQTQQLEEEMRQNLESVQTGAEDTFYPLAFSIFLQDIPKAYDSDHYLQELVAEVELRDGDIYWTETFEGLNASESATEYLSVLITSEAQIDAAELDFQLEHRDGNEWQESENWEAERVAEYDTLVKLYFPEPLDPSEEFGIRWSATFDEPTDLDEHYFHFPCHRFRRGIDRLHIEMALDGATDVEMRRVSKETTDHYRDAGRVQLTPDDIEELDPNVAQKRDGTLDVTFADERTSALYLARAQF